MLRQMDQARLFTRSRADSLTNPPGGIRSEMTTALVIKLLGGTHESQVAFLDQINKRDTRTGITTSDSDNQTEITLDQPAPRQFITGCGLTCQVYFFSMCEQSQSTNIAQVTLKCVFGPRRLPGGC